MVASSDRSKPFDSFSRHRYGDLWGPGMSVDSLSSVVFTESATATKTTVETLRRPHCRACGAGFLDLKSLIHHLKTHRRAVCDICTKAGTSYVSELVRTAPFAAGADASAA